MKKKVLLSGAGPTGFIGRNLFDALHEKYDLFTPTSKELDLRDYEVTAKYIDSNKIDAIIHSASCAVNTLDSDLRMYFNLEKLSRNIDKVICFGSGAEYDKRFDIVKASENDIGNRIPVDGYGFAKYVITTHARLTDNIYVLRLFGIFGKYEDWTYKFISNICCKAVFDLPLTIRRDCRFDYLYVNDLPKVVEWIMESNPTHTDYNVVFGSSILLTELANIVLSASGKNLEILVLDPNEQNNEYTACCKRLNEEINGFRRTPHEEAIHQLYSYYYDNKKNVSYDVIKNTK